MVPLRLDVCEDRPRWVEARPRPQLVLKDVAPEPSPRRRAKRSPLHRIENVLLITALAAALLFFVLNFAFSLFHTVQQSYFPSTTPSVVMISKTVARGDTLTRFAKKYLAPGTYMPDGIEQIARANHLSGFAPLVPGQHLLIPVTNPTVIAQIENYRLQSHRALIAAR